MKADSERAALPQTAVGLPPIPDPFWQIVDEGIARISLVLDPHQRSAIDQHVRLLLAWNKAINLTALRQPEQIARGHVLDSLVAVPALRESSRAATDLKLLDLGSGGGFPGLPLAAVLPATRAALVDSVGKKARFLEVASRAVESAIAEGGVGEAPELSALAERAEGLADEAEHQESWDLVVCRAVGTVAEVAELGLPLTRRGGTVAIWKRDDGGGELQAEMRAASRICQAAGGGQPRRIELKAAESVGLTGHCLVTIAKQRPTPERYPRPAAERRRAPLLS